MPRQPPHSVFNCPALNGHRVGVVHRCGCPSVVFEAGWDTLKVLTEDNTCESISWSDAPETAGRLEWVFVEEPAIVNASAADLKRRFREWALSENPDGIILDPPRYQYFVQADWESLLSASNNGLNKWTPDHGTSRIWRDGPVIGNSG
ncbi:hypothetical protein GGTG_01056 [Gaeumannomyces tritici R3-111a-1]|uniref:Uncharacterized protein n=1 Tax=Gaeumannomyces tritici (strain R3-111a-1) TaxID=644352 RepID=J3NIH6_GAET3|nr:hypothetical protein GGTG_01056 [Gaeumannomyces tritici R3-111a-1]EJT81069.1 hypothetical protein GGTG_01056 [Gaeumannomyces tritici R3-111a-1]